MPTIRMKRTTEGSPDGFHVKRYDGDKEYTVDSDIPARLAGMFINMKVAEYVTAGKPVEEKTIPEAPENAAVEAAPENKETEKVKEKPKEQEYGWEPPKKKDKDKAKGKVMRVYELADELKISSKDVLIAAENLGVYARNAASGLSEEEVEKVSAALKK